MLAYLGQVGQAANTYQDVATQNFQKQMLAEQALGQAKSDWQNAELQRKQQNKELVVSTGLKLGELGVKYLTGGGSEAIGAIAKTVAGGG